MLSHFNDIENRIKWFEFYSETFNWNDYNFYRNYNHFNFDFINEFKLKINWGILFAVKTFPESFINKYIKYYTKHIWYNISCHQKLSESFIEKFKDKVDWVTISAFQKLSESFIEKFKDNVSWYDISCHQKLSESFIEKFKDKVDWQLILQSQILSKQFIQKMIKNNIISSQMVSIYCKNKFTF